MKPLLAILITVLLLAEACSKSASDGEALFYGRWLTSYGDTVVFSRQGGQNQVSFDYSMNPLMPQTSQHRFACFNQKLAIDYSFDPSAEFKTFDSFYWTDKGKEFKIKAFEWFNFVSSTQSWFTFTRID